MTLLKLNKSRAKRVERIHAKSSRKIKFGRRTRGVSQSSRNNECGEEEEVRNGVRMKWEGEKIWDLKI